MCGLASFTSHPLAENRTVGDMPKSPSSQYGLKAQEDIDPRGIRVTNEPIK